MTDLNISSLGEHVEAHIEIATEALQKALAALDRAIERERDPSTRELLGNWWQRVEDAVNVAFAAALAKGARLDQRAG